MGKWELYHGTPQAADGPDTVGTVAGIGDVGLCPRALTPDGSRNMVVMRAVWMFLDQPVSVFLMLIGKMCPGRRRWRGQSLSGEDLDEWEGGEQRDSWGAQPCPLIPIRLHRPTSSAVTMAITLAPCSHTICQNSWHVCGSGPCVAM